MNKEELKKLTQEIDNELSEVVDGFNINYSIQKVDLDTMTINVEFALHEYEGIYSLTHY